jgi:hypothetical protein
MVEEVAIEVFQGAKAGAESIAFSVMVLSVVERATADSSPFDFAQGTE